MGTVFYNGSFPKGPVLTYITTCFQAGAPLLSSPAALYPASAHILDSVFASPLICIFLYISDITEGKVNRCKAQGCRRLL